MKKKAGLCLGVVALLVLAILVSAAEREAPESAPAQLGGPAAPLAGLEWIKGGPAQLTSGSITVVEFWATWCPPCRTSIPHLTEIEDRFKDQDVTVIGVSNETADIVRPFVEQMDEKMEYVVAVDRQGHVWKGYMDAFGVRGIPHAFIVGKDGNIVWHGHPMAGMDEVLEEVVNDRFDAVAYAAKQAAREKEEARVLALYKSYFTTVGADPGEAAAIGAQLIGSDNSAMLNALAWRILTNVPQESRDLELAREAAAKAVKLTEEKNPSILDTYALAMYELGKKYVAQAVTLQKKAVELTDNEQARESLQKALQRYESATIE